MLLVPLEGVDGGDKVASHGQPDKMLRLYVFEIPFHINDEKRGDPSAKLVALPFRSKSPPTRSLFR